MGIFKKNSNNKSKRKLILKTINGKKVEIAVKKILHGSEALNKDALANPESLLFFKDLDVLKD